MYKIYNFSHWYYHLHSKHKVTFGKFIRKILVYNHISSTINIVTIYCINICINI